MALPTNKHAGACYLCGLLVQPNTGRFERHNGVWRVKHAGKDSVGKGLVTCEEAKKNTIKYCSTSNCNNKAQEGNHMCGECIHTLCDKILDDLGSQ